MLCLFCAAFKLTCTQLCICEVGESVMCSVLSNTVALLPVQLQKQSSVHLLTVL